jgi:hypothetical protein
MWTPQTVTTTDPIEKAARDAVIANREAARKKAQEEQDFLQNNIRQGIGDARNRQAPQMVGAQVAPVRTMDTGQSDQFRAAQMGLLNQYQAIANGQQAGAGELGVQRQAQRALGNAAGAATMARGNSAIGGSRAAARAAGAIGLGAAGQAQQAQLSDQAAARQAMMGITGQGREQDIGIAGANQQAENQRIFQQAGIDQSTSMENAHMKLQQMGLNDAQIANMLGMLNAQRLAQISKPREPGFWDYFTNLAGPAAAYASGKK